MTYHSESRMSEARTTSSILTQVLIAVLIGVLGWVGYTVQQTAVSTAVVVDKVATHDRDILDLRTRVASVEIQLAQLKRTN